MSRVSELRDLVKERTRRVSRLELDLADAREDLTAAQGQLAEAERPADPAKESLL
jgi:outer membrane murein-binding lipoprotein Lpp